MRRVAQCDNNKACRNRSLAGFLALLLFGLILLSGVPLSAVAQNSEKNSTDVNAKTKLQRLELELKKRQARHKKLSDKAARADLEQARFRRRLINAGRSAKQREINLLKAEKRLLGLRQQELALSSNLISDRQDLSLVLGALSRLSRRPEPILAAEPNDILDSLRSSILFASVVPELRARADRLQQRLTVIDSLRLNISRQKIRIAKVQTGLENEQARIKRLLRLKISEKKRLQIRAAGEQKRLRILAEDAKDLRDLIEKIALSAKAAREREARIRELKQNQTLAALGRDGGQNLGQNLDRNSGQNAAGDKAQDAAKKRHSTGPLTSRQQGTLVLPSAPFSKAKGLVQLPVAGRIIRRFGENDKHGLHAKGIRIKVRPGSQIVAPYDGEIAYAGSFRGYGLLLIIAHGEGYHTLISGLTRSHVVVGQLVLANEPIGEMVMGKNSNLTLYVELRRRGEAINPLPWMAARNDKVNG
jgi:septal ring factor EnvC (AmiA/AmiB activator)